MSVKTPVGLAEVYVLAKEVVIVPILGWPRNGR